MKWLIITLSFCIAPLYGQLYYNAPNASAFNPLNNRYFVSNEGSGEIFQIDRSGNKWLFAKGLQSPRNVAFHKLPIGWSLLVLDSNRMVIYDTSGNLLGSETISGIGQIQDCVYDSSDLTLYTTDRKRGVIYKTKFSSSAPYGFQTSIWVKNLVKPSALILQKSKGRLLLVQDTTNSGLISINIKDSTAQLLRYLNLSNVMGLAEDDQGNLYFSALAEQYIYQLNKYYKGSPKALIREPKPGDLTVVGHRNEWVYTCILCGKVYVAALHLFGPDSEVMACAGDSFDTYKNPFLKNIGTFEAGNEFVLELSDENGDFSKGYSLNRIADTLIPGSISGVLPKGLVSGMGYKVRWSSTKPAVKGWLQMTEVLPKPRLTLSAKGDTLIDCGGQGLRLKAQDSFELADFSWWKNGERVADSSMYLWVKSDSSVKVVLSAKASSSGCISMDSVVITKGAIPAWDSWESSLVACQGDSVSLGSSMEDAAGVTAFTWRRQLDSRWLSTMSNPRVLAWISDSFYVAIANKQGCQNTYHQFVEVTSRDSIRWKRASDTVLEITSMKGGRITWYKNGVQQLFSDARWEKPDSGLYWACTQVDLDCIHCTESYRVAPRVELGWRYGISRENIRVKPNPSAGLFYVDQVSGPWEVLTMQGRKIAEGSGSVIDIRNASPGLYWLNFPGIGSIALHKCLE